MEFSVGEFVNRALKYLVEGLAVATAAIFIPKKSLPLEEIASLALVAAAVFAVLGHWLWALFFFVWYLLD